MKRRKQERSKIKGGSDMARLDDEILKIQRSTKATVPLFTPIHNKLRLRFSWYYHWHLLGWSNIIHYSIMAILVLMLGVYSYSNRYTQYIPTEAAMGAKTWTSQADFATFTKTNTSETEVTDSLTLLGPAPYTSPGYAYANYDATATKTWHSLTKAETLNGQAIAYYGKTSADTSCSDAGTWTGWTQLTFTGNTASLIGFSNSRYFCVGVNLSTTDTNVTPQVDSLSLKTADTTDCYWTNAGGNNSWGTASNWSCGVVPTSANDVYFDGAISNANATIGSAATVGSITVRGTNLPTSGDVGYSGTITANSTFTTSIASSKTGAFYIGGGTYTSGANSVTVIGNFSQFGGTFNAPSSNLNVKLDFTSSAGTFNHNSGTVVINTTGYSVIATATNFTFNNLTINKVNPNLTITLNNNFNVNGNLTVTGGILTSVSAVTIPVSGNYTLNGATVNGTVTLNLSGNVVISSGTSKASINFINTSADQTISQTGGTISGGTWNVNDTGRTTKQLSVLTLGNAMGSKAVLNVTAGTFLQNGYALTVSDLNQSGGTFTSGASTLTLYSPNVPTGGALILSGGVFNAPSSYLYLRGSLTRTGGTFNHNSGTFQINVFAGGIGAENDIRPGTGLIVNNLEVTRSGPLGGVVKIFADFAVAGNMSFGLTADSIGYTFSADTTAKISVAGNLSLGGSGGTMGNTYTIASSITFDLSGNFTSTNAYAICQANINFINTSADQTITQTAGTISGGTWTIDDSGRTTKLAAAFTMSGTATLAVVNGIFSQNGYDATLFTFNQSGGTYTAGSNNLTVTKTFTQSNGTFNSPSSTLTINNTFNRSGGTFNANSGTAQFNMNASVGYTVTTSGLVFNNLIFYRSGPAAGPITLNDDFSAAGNLTMSIAASSAGGTVTGSAGRTITVAGNLNFIGTGLSNLILDSNITVNLSGNFNMTGSTNTCKANISFVNSSADQTVTQSAGTISTGTWTVNKGSYSTIQQTAIATIPNLTITSGKWYTNGQNLTATTLNNNGTLKINGSETLTITNKDTDSGTIEYAGTGTYSSLLYGNTYYSLSISGSGSFTAAAATTLAGSYSQAAGTFIAPSAANLNVAGNFSHTAGVFNANTGTVILNGTNQTVSGDTTFYNLTKTVTTARTLTFAAGSKQTISNSVNFSGAAGQLLSLHSGTDNSQWQVSIPAGQTLNYLSVKDSDNSTGILAIANNSIDEGNNINWAFGINISGTVYTADNKSTNIGAGKTVALSVNGGAKTTVETTSGGNFTFINALIGTGDVPIILYLEGETEKASLVSVIKTTSTVDAFEMYTNETRLRYETGSSISNSVVASASALASSDMLITNNSGEITYNTADKLVIDPGKNYIPGNNFIAGDLVISAGSTLDPESRNMTLAGSFNNLGTFAPTAGTVTFNGVSGTKTINPGSGHFQNIIFNGAATFQPTSALDVNGTFTLSNGTLNLDTSDPTVNLAGNVIINGGSVTKSSTNALVTFDGDLLYDDNVGGINFGDVTIGASPDTTTLSSNITVDSLTISAGDILNTHGYDIDSAGDINIYGILDTTDTGEAGYANNGSMINVAGNFTVETDGVYTKCVQDSRHSKVIFDGAATQTLTTLSQDLGDLQTSGSGTHLDITSTLNADSVAVDVNTTFDSNSYDITVGGDFAIAGSFTAGTATTTFDGAASQNFVTNSQPFNNIVLNNTSGDGSNKIIVNGNLDVNGDLTITDGVLELATYNPSVNIAGNTAIEVSGGVEKGSGTWTFDGTAANTYEDLTVSKQNLGITTINKTGGTANKGIALKTSAGNGMKVGTLAISIGNTLNLNTGGYSLELVNTGNTADVITVNGALTIGISTVKYSAINSGGNVNIHTISYSSLELSGNETYVMQADLAGANAITANLTIGPGSTLDTVTGRNIDLAGNYTNNGAIVHHNNTIVLNGASGQSITAGGSGAGKPLYNMTVSTASAKTFSDTLTVSNLFADNIAGSELYFTPAATYTFNTIDIDGSAGNTITMHSTSDGDQWKFNVSGSPAVTYVDARDSDASGGSQIDATANCINGGNNINWLFTGGVTVSGTFYTDQSRTATLSDKTINLAINGVSRAIAETDVNGNFSMSNLTYNANDLFLFFSDNETEKASYFTQVSSSSSISDVSMIKNKVMLTHRTAGPVTNSMLATAYSGDADVRYTVTGSDAYFADNMELYIEDNMTYTPGGKVRADYLDILTGSTFNAEANEVTIHGDFQAGATSSFYTSGTFIFDCEAACGTRTIETGGNDSNHLFNNVTKSGGGTLQVKTTPIAITGTLSIGASTVFDLNGQTTNILILSNNGTLKLTGDETVAIGTFDSTHGTTEYSATSGSRKIKNYTYNNLTINGNGGTFLAPSTASVVLNGNLMISAGTFNTNDGTSDRTFIVFGNITIADTLTANASAIDLRGDWTNTGTFNAGTSTVSFTKATGLQTLDSSGIATTKAFYNLRHTGAGTLQLINNDVDVNGDIQNSSGTLVTDLRIVNVGGSFSNSATFAPTSGTFTFDAASGTSTIGLGSGHFQNIIFNGAATFQPTSALDVNGTFTLSNGTLNLDTSDPTVNLAGNVIINGGSVTKSSTNALVTFDGDLLYDDNVGGVNLGDIQIGASPDTTTLNSNIAVDSLTISAGDILNTHGYDIDSAGDINIYGILDTTDNGGAGYANNGSMINVAGNLTVETGGVYTKCVQSSRHSNVIFDGGASSDLTSNTEDLGNVELSVAGTTVTLLDSLDADDITIGVSTDLNADNYAITVAGNWLNSGAFTAGIGTVSFDGNTNQTVSTNDQSFNDLTIINTGVDNSDEIVISSTLDVNGSLSISDGVLELSQNNSDANTAGDVSVTANGEIEKGTGTWTFDGTSASTYEDLTPLKQNIGIVSVSKTNIDPVNNKLTLKTASGNGLKVDTLNVSLNNTLDLSTGGYTLDLANNGEDADVFVNDGTLIPGTSSVKYSAENSLGDINITAAAYSTLELAGLDTYVLTNNQTELNAITGNLLIRSNSVLDTSSSNFDIELTSGNWINEGSFTANTSKVIFSKDSGVQSIDAGGSGVNKAFYDVFHSGDGILTPVNNNISILGTLENANGTLNGNALTMFIGKDWINNASFTPSGGTVNFNGGDNTNQTISGDNTFYNLEASTVLNNTGRTITFDQNSTQTIANRWSFNGQTGKLLVLVSSDPVWNINPTAIDSITLSYLDVKNSTNIGVRFCAPYSVDSGTNTNWHISSESWCHDDSYNVAPSAPSDLTQTMTDATIIPVGGWTNEDRIYLKATAFDENVLDHLQLCAEVKPTTERFTNTEDSCSEAKESRMSPLVLSYEKSDLIVGQGYHWQARVKDEHGIYSSWVSFGSNAEDQRDFARYDGNVQPDNQPPMAIITAPSRAIVGTKVAVSGSRSIDNVGIISYLWHFSDNSSGNGRDIDKTFDITGSFDISLHVSDRAGNTGDAKAKIDIVPAAPIITLIEQRNRDLVISGTSSILSKIALYFSPEGSIDRTLLSGSSDKEGNWTIVLPRAYDTLAEGNYIFYAYSTDSNKMTSDKSDDYYFEIKKIAAGTEIRIDTGMIGKAAKKVVENNDKIISIAVAASVAELALSFGLMNLLAYLQSLFTMLLQGVGARKRRNPWGVVYDAISKNPLDLVIVRIYQNDTKKLCDTCVTDKYGRYGFVVAPGEYYLKIIKSGYLWPSRRVAPGVSQDDVYTNIYHEEVFKVHDDQTAVFYDIPVDPLSQKEKSPSFKILKWLKSFFQKYLIFFLVFSALTTVASFIMFKKTLDIFSFALVGIFIIKDVLNRRVQFNWGMVYDSKTKKPIADATVRIFDATSNSQKAQKVTDKFGRYGFLVPPGKYYLEVEKENYISPSKVVTKKNDGMLSNVYHGEKINKEYPQTLLSYNIPIDKEEN